MRDSEIFGEAEIADQISDQQEGEAGDDDRHRRQPVEAVGEVHRIAERHDHEGAEDDVEIAEVGDRLLDEGQVQVAVPDLDHDPSRDSGDHELQGQPRLARYSRVMALSHLVVIVEEADQPEPRRDQQARPDVRVAKVHPQQRRYRHRDQDQQPAHGRRAALGEVGLRAVGADRLAAPLPPPQVRDEPRPEQQPDQQRRRSRRPGAEADVADEVEQAREVELLGDQVEHRASSFVSRSTTRDRPTELDALTSTASPGRSIASTASPAALRVGGAS